MLTFGPRIMDAKDCLSELKTCAEGGGSSGLNSRRKRPRELVESATGFAVNSPGRGFNVFSIGEPVHVTDVDSYHVQQRLLGTQYGVFAGLRLSPSEVEHRMRVPFPQHQYGSYSDGPASSCPLLNLSADLAAEILRRGDALDGFLREQGERLRKMVAIETSNLSHSLLLEAERSFAWKLSEKEKELEDARRRHEHLLLLNIQLTDDFCAAASRAKILESEVTSLWERIKNASTTASSGSGSCDGDVAPAEDEGSLYVDPDRVVGFGFGPICKGCIARAASVVVLPCRHLCFCMDCSVAAIACPVCLRAKTSAVEVRFS